MKERTIGRIDRTKGLDYRIDKEGNIIESGYNWFKDRNTLVMLVILILGCAYYLEMSQSATNAQNFDKSCNIYYNWRQNYIDNNPGQPITLSSVLSYYENNKLNSTKEFNLTTHG